MGRANKDGPSCVGLVVNSCTTHQGPQREEVGSEPRPNTLRCLSQQSPKMSSIQSEKRLGGYRLKTYLCQGTYSPRPDLVRMAEVAARETSSPSPPFLIVDCYQEKGRMRSDSVLPCTIGDLTRILVIPLLSVVFPDLGPVAL